MLTVALTSFALGLLSSTSPCILPLYPGYLAYISGRNQEESGRTQYFLGLCVLAGVLTMMILLGALIALLAIPVGRALAIAIPLSDVVIFILGVLLLLGINPFERLPQLQIPVHQSPLANAFVYGLLYGPITLPCSGPLLVSIFALSLTLQDALSNLWLFLCFGLGLGLPLLLLSLLSGVFQRRLVTQLARHIRLINILGGILLIGISVYDLSKNWSMISLFFS